MDSTPDRTIYVLNGPKLNLLGTREPQTYGYATLPDVERLCVDTAARFGLKIPALEAHVSNIHARESFRHQSFARSASFAVVCGFGTDGYRLAIDGLSTRIEAKA
jgi:3-dehydroquinate dehydratase II